MFDQPEPTDLTPRHIQAGSLYVVVSVQSADALNYRRETSPSLTQQRILQGLLEHKNSGLYWDLYLHHDNGLGTLYRYLVENGNAQRVDRLSVLRHVKNILNVEYLIGIVRVMDFGPEMADRVDRFIATSQPPDAIKDTVNWCFTMLGAVEKKVREDCRFPGRPLAPPTINIQNIHDEVAHFAGQHIESALRGKKPRPILNLWTRIWVTPGDGTGSVVEPVTPRSGAPTPDSI